MEDNRTMEEERYTSVSSVRKQIATKIQNLHEFLDERKLALNEELDDLEQTFAVENQKEEEELSKLTAYKGQTLALFKDVEARNDLQLLKIETRINELNKLLEMRKVRLQWSDGRVRREVSSLGVLELRGRTQDPEEDYELMNNFSQSVPASPSANLYIRESSMIEDPLEYSDMASVKPIESKDLRAKENKTLPPRIPSEYIKPVRKVPSKGSTMPPPLTPRNLDQTAKNLKQRVGNIKDNLKDNLMKVRTKSVEAHLDQELELYGEVAEQKQSWQRHFQHRCESVDDDTQKGFYPSPPREDYTLISKCTMGSDPGQLLKPKNVAVSTKTGNIFVAEKGNNRVQVFTQSGDHLFSFGQRMKGLSMMQPYGVCVMNEKVYVSQTQTNCIMVFKTNGDYCMQGGHLGKSDGCFKFPTGLCTDGTNIYVCDHGNNRVQVLSNNLIFKQSFGIGKLTNPTDIAVDTSFNLVVLDRSNTVVHIFNSKGVHQRKLISVSKFPALSNPLFLAISPRGNIILSDLLTCSVNLFSMDGQLLWCLGGLHDKETFGEPRGVTCDMFGRLVVACNKKEGCLKIIQIRLPSLF